MRPTASPSAATDPSPVTTTTATATVTSTYLSQSGIPTAHRHHIGFDPHHHYPSFPFNHSPIPPSMHDHPQLSQTSGAPHLPLWQRQHPHQSFGPHYGPPPLYSQPHIGPRSMYGQQYCNVPDGYSVMLYPNAPAHMYGPPSYAMPRQQQILTGRLDMPPARSSPFPTQQEQPLGQSGPSQSHIKEELPSNSAEPDQPPEPVQLRRRKGKQPQTQIPPPMPEPKRISRPSNSFMTYRMDKKHEVLAQHPGANNKDISVIIGEMWRNESEPIKEHYRRKAELGRKEHALKYPDYRYRPVKKRKKPAPTAGSSSGNAGPLRLRKRSVADACSDVEMFRSPSTAITRKAPSPAPGYSSGSAKTHDNSGAGPSAQLMAAILSSNSEGLDQPSNSPGYNADQAPPAGIAFSSDAGSTVRSNESIAMVVDSEGGLWPSLPKGAVMDDEFSEDFLEMLQIPTSQCPIFYGLRVNN